MRRNGGYSEWTGYRYLRSLLNFEEWDNCPKEHRSKLIREQDLNLRKQWKIGRGLEYKFHELSFHEVEVGFQIFSKKSGSKRGSWNRVYFRGCVGPLIWYPFAPNNALYIVKFFRDNDIRRFYPDSIVTFLLTKELDGIQKQMNELLNF